MTNKLLFNIHEVSAMLGMSAGKLYRLVEARKIKHHKDGSVKFSQGDIDDYLSRTQAEIGQPLPKQKKYKLKHLGA